MPLAFPPSFTQWVRAQSFSCVWLYVTLWTVALQAPLSTGFSRQEYWSGLPFPPAEDLPNPGIKLVFPVAPVLQGDSLPWSQLESPSFTSPLGSFFLLCLAFLFSGLTLLSALNHSSKDSLLPSSREQIPGPLLQGLYSLPQDKKRAFGHQRDRSYWTILFSAALEPCRSSSWTKCPLSRTPKDDFGQGSF